MKPEALKDQSAKNDKKSVAPPYQSNPFSLSFNTFGQFFEKNLGWAIALILLPAIGFFFQIIVSAMSTISSNAHAANLDATPTTIGFVSVIFIIAAIIIAIASVAGIAINIFIYGLFTYVAMENDAGRKAGFSDAMNVVVARFWRLFLAQLLATVKIIGWTLLFIVPGIIAAFRYALLPFVILDEPASETGVKKSHDRVKALVSGRKREVFGVATVAAIIPIVGGINQLLGNAALYRQLQTYYDKKLEKPEVHWLNYLGFVLLGLYILLIIMIVMIVAIAAIYGQSLPDSNKF